MRNVAFVPEGDVFVGGEHVRTHNASEAADLLAGDGIAFVGHGGAATLLSAERFFGFANFGALEVANFEGDFFERGGDESERAEILRVAIALDDLGSDRSDGEAELFADALFHFGAEMRSVADCAGNFPHSHTRGGGAEAADVALIF